MADGEIIIMARLNSSKAEAEMKDLQQQAKSTAKEMDSIGKRIEKVRGNTKLAGDLAKARSNAEATARQLDEVNARIDAARHSKYGEAAVNPKDVEQSDKLAALLAQQDAKAAEIEGQYQRQQQTLTTLTQQHTALKGQLDQEESAAAQAAARYAEMEAAAQRATEFKKGDDAMQNYFAKQAAAVEKDFARIEQRQDRAFGTQEQSATEYAEHVVRETQRAVDAQEKAAQKAEEAARRTAAAGAAKKPAADETGSKETAANLERASAATSRFGTRLRGIVASALVFNWISAGLRVFMTALGGAISRTNGFQQALANLKGAAMTAAAPLIEVLGRALTYIINLMASAINMVARLIATLTGRSIGSMQAAAKGLSGVGAAAGGAAKKTKEAGKEAKKARGELAAFDELNVLNTQEEEETPEETGGGGGGAADGLAFGDAMGGVLDGLLDKIKAFWAGFLEKIEPGLAAWAAAWEQIKAKALEVWPDIKNAALGLWNDGILPLLNYLGNVFVPTMFNSFSEAFAPITGGVISAAIQVFADFFVWACEIITNAINTLVIPALDLFLDVWVGLCNGFLVAWQTYGQPIMDAIILGFQLIWDALSALYYTVVQPILANLVTVLDTLWNDHLQLLWQNILLLVGSISLALLDFWNGVLMPIINWLIEFFGPMFTAIFNGCADILGLNFGLMTDMIAQITAVFTGLIDFLRVGFTQGWGAAWEGLKATFISVWEGMKNAAKNYINGIIGFINGMIQAIVNGMNAVISALNGLNFDVPEWVPGLGGKSLGFDLQEITAPQIPYLAQGAVIPPNREFMAVLGDQSAGTNIEAPLDTIKQALAEVLGDGGEREIVIKFAASGGLEQLVRLLKPYIDKENSRRGAKLISGGVY